MATRTVTTLVDDLDGSSSATENVSFGLDRVEYEIDLSAEHAGTLREVLAPYLAAARRTGGRRGARGPQPTQPGRSVAGGGPRSRSTNADIRAWAAGHGVALAERGRLPGRVIEAFEAGDPARLPGPGGSSSATEAQTPAEPVDTSPDHAAAPQAAGSDDQPRGRDGLTTTEREVIRAWAMEQGIEVKTRGQLKKDLVANHQAWLRRQ